MSVGLEARKVHFAVGSRRDSLGLRLPTQALAILKVAKDALVHMDLPVREHHVRARLPSKIGFVLKQWRLGLRLRIAEELLLLLAQGQYLRGLFRSARIVRALNGEHSLPHRKIIRIFLQRARALQKALALRFAQLSEPHLGRSRQFFRRRGVGASVHSHAG